MSHVPGSSETTSALGIGLSPIDRQRYESLLARVRGPARLAGGEVNTAPGFSGAPDETRLVLAFPDAYEVGISNQALQILYHVAAETPHVGVERVYLPWVDAIAELRSEGLPLVTLETWTPVRDAHVLAVTLQHELSYTNLLELLDLAGIPATAAARDDSHPLVIGGGPAGANFLPVAPFLDAMAVGDGECILPDVLRTVGQVVRSGRPARAVQEELAEIAGVYVPGESSRVRRRVVPRLAGAPYPAACLVPVTEGVHDRAWVEVMRGCSRGCRYCQAGMWYRPVRERPAAEVIALVDAELAATGHEEVSLGSLSTTDYSAVEDVLRRLALEHPDVKVSLPSLRVDSAGVRLGHLTSPTSPSVTLAPEAGSQRLRDVINKNVSEDSILRAAEEAVRLGHTTLKLYFMIGLPTETDDDVSAIVTLCRAIRERSRAALGGRAGRLRLNVSVTTFIPKPFTPFQWASMADRATLERRQDLLRSGLRLRGVRTSLHGIDAGYVEAALARGGEELAPVIQGAWERGARFDSWTELFDLGAWTAAFVEVGGRTAEERAGAGYERDTPFPWDVVEGVVDRGFLWREWERALAAATSPDCRWEACLDCGACDGGLAPDPAVGATSDPATLEVRTPTVTAAAATVAEPSGGRWILTYAVHGPARFLGHLDTAEAVRRSVRRAGGRLATSRGMRPKPRLAIALPRPVGVSGAAELVEFTLAESPGSGFVRRLEASLPPGFGLVSLERTEEAKPVAARVIGARYRVVATGSDADGITPEELADGAGRYTRLPEIMVERVRAGGTKTFDVRSFVSGLEVRSVGDGVGVPSAEIEVEFETAVTPEGTARPEDVVTALGRLLGRSLTPVSAERLAIILRSSNHEGIEGA